MVASMASAKVSKRVVWKGAPMVEMMVADVVDRLDSQWVASTGETQAVKMAVKKVVSTVVRMADQSVALKAVSRVWKSAGM
jgi:hypothetical protein